MTEFSARTGISFRHPHAQITTAVATAKRERSRLAWEQDRQDREWKLREEERWLAEKRELYASFGAAAHEFLSYISAKINENDSSELPPPELPDIEPLNRIRANIDLMAPEEVSGAAGFCVVIIMSAIWAINSKDTPGDKLKYYLNEVRRTWSDVHYAMRRDLHGQQQRFKRAAPKSLDRPPDEPPAHATRRWRREAKKHIGSE